MQILRSYPSWVKYGREAATAALRISCRSRRFRATAGGFVSRLISIALYVTCENQVNIAVATVDGRDPEVVNGLSGFVPRSRSRRPARLWKFELLKTQRSCVQFAAKPSLAALRLRRKLAGDWPAERLRISHNRRSEKLRYD